MALIGEMKFLERMQFFNGQRLFASDLQGLEAFNREMRWLHNQSLHQPGVGSGFAVIGKKGDREVTILPGYAIDALGREIVLTEKHVEPVPPKADDGSGKPVSYYLTVSYPSDEELEESETREGICLPRGVVRLREAPIFCWVLLDGDPLHPDLKLQNDITNGMKIILAQAEVLNCQLKQDLSTAQRRNARPAQQPYVACGATSPDTKWELWPDSNKKPIGLQVENIDTTTARFRTKPCYSAHIIGNRFFDRVLDVDGDGTKDSFLLDGFANIIGPSPKEIEPTRSGFTLRVLMPQMSFELVSGGKLLVNPEEFFKKEDNLNLLKQNNWHVVWMGVEG
ncbi:hypothetical protein HYR54_05160 [Candidatus Acetothermia bacterium]|nr:hypothetical protein [Candidatus Acetothermia bacterium]